MNISVIVPTVNSEKVIKNSIQHFENYLKKNKQVKKYEIIIAAQSSDDNTFQVIKKLKSKTVKPLFIKIRGKGNGINHGIRAAKHELILIIDDDLSYPIEFLDNALHYIQFYDIIIGSRYLTWQDIPMKRKIASWTYRMLVKTLFRIKQKDIQAGEKLVKKDIFKKIKVNQSGYVWDTEFLSKANKQKLKIKEVPIKYDFRNNYLKVGRAAPKMFKEVMRLYFKK